MTQTANNYGKALYELSIPKEEVERTAKVFEEVPKLLNILQNPTILRKKKYAVIDRIFDGKMSVFLKLLCKYGRINQLTDVFIAYREHYEKQHGILHGQIYYVNPLGETEKKRIVQFLKDRFLCEEVLLEEEKEEALLGGYLLKADGIEFDFSYEGRLHQLEKKLTGR